MAGYLTPYPTTQLQEVKNVLQHHQPGITVMLPPSESPLNIRDQNGNIHTFIDKFYIYYLNQPSYYYGLNGDITNKYLFFFTMASLSNRESWWTNFLHDANVRYLVINKELIPGSENIPSYMEDIQHSLLNQPWLMKTAFRKIYENRGFAVFEMTKNDKSSSTDDQNLTDINWQSFLCKQTSISSVPTSTQQWINFRNNPHAISSIVSDHTDTSDRDYFSLINPQYFILPDSSGFPFNQEQIPSSQYFESIFPMLNLFTPKHYNFGGIIMPGPFDTLTSTFVSLPQSTSIRFKIPLSQSGTYDLYVRTIATMNSLSLQLNNNAPISRIIDPSETGQNSFKHLPILPQ